MAIDPEVAGKIGGNPDGRGILIEMVSISGVTEVVFVRMHACMYGSVCVHLSFSPPIHVFTRVVACTCVCAAYMSNPYIQTYIPGRTPVGHVGHGGLPRCQSRGAFGASPLARSEPLRAASHTRPGRSGRGGWVERRGGRCGVQACDVARRIPHAIFVEMCVLPQDSRR